MGESSESRAKVQAVPFLRQQGHRHHVGLRAHGVPRVPGDRPILDGPCRCARQLELAREKAQVMRDTVFCVLVLVVCMFFLGWRVLAMMDGVSRILPRADVEAAE